MDEESPYKKLKEIVNRGRKRAMRKWYHTDQGKGISRKVVPERREVK